MPNSYPPSWKVYYREAMQETDAEMLTEFVLAAEHAIGLRLRELGDSADRYNERIEMKHAAADLLAIKTYKLHRP